MVHEGTVVVLRKCQVACQFAHSGAVIMFATCICLSTGLWQVAFGCVKIQKYELSSLSRNYGGIKGDFPVLHSSIFIPQLSSRC